MLFGLFSSSADVFVSTWKTDNTGTSNDDQITLPLIATGTYNFTVYWGDGNADKITAYDDAAVTHTYASAGTYTVVISGQIEGWRFANGGDKLKITDVSQWGNLIVGTDEKDYFAGCSNLYVSATDELDVSSVTVLQGAFYNCSSLTTLDVSNWDVSSVTSLYMAFNSCGNLTTLNVSNWDVSSVTSLYFAFYGCSSLTTLDVSNWDVSSVTDMRYAFYNCDAMSSAQLGAVKDWNIGSLTDATNFMQACTNSMSTADYDALLIAWEGQNHNNDVTIHFNAAKYTAGGAAATARAALVTDGWTISDGGAA